MDSRMTGVFKGCAAYFALFALASICAAGEPDERIAQLMQAAFQGNAEAVSRLLDQGVDVDSRYIDNETALIFASLKGHVNVVKLLLERGADVRAKDNKGRTALEYAVQRNRTHVAKILKSHMTK